MTWARMIHFPVNRTGVVAKVWAVNGKKSPPCLVEHLPCDCWEVARQQYHHHSLGPPKPTCYRRFEILCLTQPATFSCGGRETGRTWKSWITLLFALNFVTDEKCLWAGQFFSRGAVWERFAKIHCIGSLSNKGFHMWEIFCVGVGGGWQKCQEKYYKTCKCCALGSETERGFVGA